MKPGDVVLIPFPFSDLTTKKVRPALAISSSDYNDSQEDVILLSITSNTTQPSPYDIIIDSAEEEFETTGVKKTSAVRTSHIFTLEKALAKSLLGNISGEFLQKVRASLKELFEIT